MAKQTRRPDPEPKKPAPVAPVAPQTPEKESPIDSRFAIPLDKDGNVLVSTMRDTSKAKLKELILNPALARELGASGAETGALTLPAELMYPLVGALSIFETLLIQRVTHAPREIIERVVPFSREETKQIAPALASVLSKYGSGFLQKYGEETALLAMLSMMTMHKLGLVREEMERLGPRVAPLPFVAPAPPTPDVPPSPGDES